MRSLYSETPTWLHPVSAGAKLFTLLLMSLLLFQHQRLDALIGLACVTGLLLLSLGRVAWVLQRLLIGLAVACTLLMVFHVWQGQTNVGWITVLRLLCATVLGACLTLTTRPSDLLTTFEKVFAPLRWMGVQPERLSLSLALMLRFIEHFFALWQKLDDAHRLRTGKSGGFKILAPLTLQMLMTARRVADALSVRLGR